MSITKTRISATVNTNILDQIKKYTHDNGMSQSAVIEQALTRLLYNQLDSDVAELAKLQFDDLPDENTWLSIQSNIND